MLTDCKKINCSHLFSRHHCCLRNVDKLNKRVTMKKPCAFMVFQNINEEQIKYYSKELIINFFVLRLFNIYGGNNSLNNNFGVISKWIKNINLNRNIVLDNRGKCTRDFVYIDDLLRVIINIFSKKKNKLTIYNVGSGKQTSLSYLLKLIKNEISLIKKKKINLYFESRKLDNSQIKFSYSSNRLQRPLNIKFTKIENGIKSLIKKFQNKIMLHRIRTNNILITK